MGQSYLKNKTEYFDAKKTARRRFFVSVMLLLHSFDHVFNHLLRITEDHHGFAC
jgi:hypothetical protein